MQPRIRVSIIIPTYNRRLMLTEALHSCFAQKGVDVEVIVVDDGSTDDSIAAINKIFSDIVVIHQNRKGASAARNVGLEIASGDCIKFLDSDDRLAPDTLSVQAISLMRTDADVIYGDFEIFGNLQDPRVGGMPHRITGQIDNPLEALLGEWWCAPFCYLYRRDAIGSQRWREDLDCLQDFEFIVRFALRRKNFHYLPGTVGYYRIHTNQITQNSSYRYALNRCKILEDVIANISASRRLTRSEKQLVAHGFWTAARTFYPLDRSRFAYAVSRVHDLAPNFRPKRLAPWPVRMLTGLFGIENAERMFKVRRDLLATCKSLDIIV